jgi:YGGT family
MTMDQVDRTVVTQTGAGEPADTVRATSHVASTRTWDPGRSEMGRRIAVLVFGLIQVVIGLRFILLLLDARDANGLVSGILSVSQLFVAPFEGILRTDALHVGGSVFDVTALVALLGWTILELLVIWAVGIFRRPQTA